jgi:hypothetical protein
MSRCLLSASTSTTLMLSVRTLSIVFGATSRPRQKLCSIRNCAFSRSTCFHCRPNTSPVLAPVSARTWNNTRYFSGVLSKISRICTGDQMGFSIRRTVGLWRLRIGDFAMRSLSTASEMRGIHPFFEVADAFANSAHHIGNLFTPEQQHYHRQNDNQMKRAQCFHKSPAFQTFPGLG